jgi:hypothetical protein
MSNKKKVSKLKMLTVVLLMLLPSGSAQAPENPGAKPDLSFCLPLPLPGK